MAIYEVTSGKIQQIHSTTFCAAGLKERTDLQRLLRDHIAIIAPDTLVIAEEFGDWEDSRRRIDLLAVDKDANLVVIELKRTEDGGHMELQAIRYAAMISAMTFQDAVDAFRSYLRFQGKDLEPEKELLEFLNWSEPDEESFAQNVRIVLASADFSKELSTSVIWLNEQGLDIRCVRLQLYEYLGNILMDVEQVLPLPEAAEYQVKLREKAQKEKVTKDEKSERHSLRREFFTQLLERARPRTSLHANMTPTADSWQGTSAALGSSYWSYVIGQHVARVELYIDLGSGRADDNLWVFRTLLSQKDRIEGEYGGSLDWQDLPGKQACRIAAQFDSGGYRSDRDLWPGIADTMIDSMIRLEKAMRPHLTEIRKGLNHTD